MSKPRIKRNNLAELRRKHNYNQWQLADALGVTQQVVSYWENGKRTPGVAKMQHIEDLLGVPKEDIFFEAFNYKTLSKKIKVKKV